MKVMRAIARALAAAAMLVPVMVLEAGRWIMRLRPGHQLPDPSDLVSDYADAAEVAKVTPEADRRILNIQALASALYHGATPLDEWLVGIGDRTLTWLEAQTGDMLLKTAQAKEQDLQAHIAGTRSIRGLLAYDPESVAAFQQAVAREAEPELERIRRRPRREPLLSVFGPIC